MPIPIPTRTLARRAAGAVLLVLLAARPVPAQPFHANDALGERLSKIQSLSTPNNAGGKNILQNSCLNKKDFSISASEKLLDGCDLPKATAEFTTKYGRPDRATTAPGGKNVLEYFLLFKENEYHIKLFLGCGDKNTEAFALVECVSEKNRYMPGGPGRRDGGPGGRPSRP